MAQSESPQKGAKLRRNLIVVGCVVGSGLIIAAAWEAVHSPDFRQKLWLTLIDKAVLGVAVAGVGYWLQQRLELFKRNQAFTAELAKARIAAYHRAFTAVSVFDYAGYRAVHEAARRVARAVGKDKAAQQDELKKLSAAFKKESDALVEVLNTERYLLGDTFCKAVARLLSQTRRDLGRAHRAPPPDDDELTRQAAERRRLREAIAFSLPAFARAPENDLQFSIPNADDDRDEIVGGET
jgi:phosphate/sulfate permease